MHNLSQSIVLLCAVSSVMSGALPADSIAASIDQVQKKFAGTTIDKRIVTGGTARKFDSIENKITDTNTNTNTNLNGNNENALAQHEYDNRMQFEKTRNDKMLDYYRYFSPTPTFEMPYPLPFYQQSFYQQPPYMPAFYPSYYSTESAGMEAGQNTINDEYEEDYGEGNELDGNVDQTDVGSRANTRRRPAASKNSPIFYIRLPATPYMYVPGMGYISQPPSIQPLAPQYPINPFINLPVNYLSNAKPNGVFQWNTQQTVPNYGQPQFPSYLPSRPSQKPYRVKPAQQPLQDSKITHLGSYLFNGRPDNIYLMPQPQYHNPYAAPYNPYAGPAMHNPYQTPPMHNPYTQPAYSPYATPNYNAPAYNAPAYNAPAYNAPAYNPQPTYNQPMYSPSAPIPNYY